MHQDEVINLLRWYAELPPSTEEGQKVAEQLAAHRMAVMHVFLDSAEFEHKLLAACALARRDPTIAETVLPTLIDGLRSRDEAHKVYSAEACRSLGSLSAVPALIDVLHYQEHETAAYHAIQAIEAIGPAAIAAMLALIEILHEASNGSHGVEVLHALGAACALGAMGDPTALPALKDCLGLEADGDELVEMLKEEAARAIRKIEAPS